MDELDSCLLLYPSEVVIFAGDFNADPGWMIDGISSHPPNEQGKILKRYLQKWDFVSGHLKCSSWDSLLTYTSEAHGSLSCIDHILCPASFCQNLGDC